MERREMHFRNYEYEPIENTGEKLNFRKKPKNILNFETIVSKSFYLCPIKLDDYGP